jgi:hypothetical protein
VDIVGVNGLSNLVAVVSGHKVLLWDDTAAAVVAGANGAAVGGVVAEVWFPLEPTALVFSRSCLAVATPTSVSVLNVAADTGVTLQVEHLTTLNPAGMLAMAADADVIAFPGGDEPGTVVVVGGSGYGVLSPPHTVTISAERPICALAISEDGHVFATWSGPRAATRASASDPRGERGVWVCYWRDETGAPTAAGTVGKRRFVRLDAPVALAVNGRGRVQAVVGPRSEFVVDQLGLSTAHGRERLFVVTREGAGAGVVGSDASQHKVQLTVLELANSTDEFQIIFSETMAAPCKCAFDSAVRHLFAVCSDRTFVGYDLAASAKTLGKQKAPLGAGQRCVFARI